MDVENERFLAAIDAVYAAASAPAKWPAALQAIADCWNDVGAILIYKRETGEIGTICSPALDEAQRDYERNEWWRHDIRFLRSEERGYLNVTDAITDRHIATVDEMERLPFFTEFLRGHDLKWFGGLNISPAPDVAVVLSIQRARGRQPFSDTELAELARIGRHVENALRLGIRLLQAEASQSLHAEVLERLGVAILLLDDGGRVISANAMARSLGEDGLSVIDGRLVAAIAPQREALNAAIARALQRGEPGAPAQEPRPILLPTLRQSGMLAVHVLPVRAGPEDEIEKLLANLGAIVVVTGGRADEPADPAVIRDVLGLTLGEARVAALIGAGLAPSEVGRRLGITDNTTRTALKRVFSKTGVSRQSELIMMLARLSLR